MFDKVIQIQIIRIINYVLSINCYNHINTPILYLFQHNKKKKLLIVRLVDKKASCENNPKFFTLVIVNKNWRLKIV